MNPQYPSTDHPSSTNSMFCELISQHPLSATTRTSPQNRVRKSFSRRDLRKRHSPKQISTHRKRVEK